MKKKIYQLAAIFTTDRLSCFFLTSIVFLSACQSFSNQSAENHPRGASGKEQPAEVRQTPRPNSSSAVPASKITKIIFSDWRHEGPLSAPGGRVVSNSVVFRRDGTASKTVNAVNYDDGKKEPGTEYAAGLTAEQFEKLAETAAENDFLNESDSKNVRSESQNSLMIYYEGGEKTIVTSNIGEDTPQITAILNAIDELKNQVEWKKK